MGTIKIKAVSIEQMVDIHDELIAQGARRQIVDIGEHRLTIFREWESADKQVGFIAGASDAILMVEGARVELSPEALLSITV